MKTDGWTKEETDHLMDLAQRFDLRFIIMADRYDVEKFTKRSIEDLKDRYYKICAILGKVKRILFSFSKLHLNAYMFQQRGEKKVYIYDADHEKRRKEQLKRLHDRTTEQVSLLIKQFLLFFKICHLQLEEEQFLLGELKKIEARKKERERKTQDLQKLISQADSQSETPRKQDKKFPKKKLTNPTRQPKVDTNVRQSTFFKLFYTCTLFIQGPKGLSNNKFSNAYQHMLQAVETAGIKFPDFKNSGVSLRSQRMKLPANVGQKKSKGLEQMLQDIGMGKLNISL